MKFEKTEQGYLKVPAKIARVGELEYTSQELGMKGDDIIKVYRDKDELFKDKVLDSFEGMPITVEHPDGMLVDSATWEDSAVGHIQNVRAEGDFIVCDAYIQSADAIKEIEETGNIELSCGYDADLAFDNSGKVWQNNIRGNHVAIVPNGRCGSSCRLGDTNEVVMKSKVKFGDSLKDIIAKMKGIKVNDNAVEEADKKTDEVATQIDEIVTALEEVQAVAEEASEAASEVADNPDATMNDDAETEALRAENEELKAKIEELEAEIERLKGEEDARMTANDAAARFPTVKFGDCSTARAVKEKALVAKKVYSSTAVKSLNDSAIDAAYTALQVSNPARSLQSGKAFLSDSKPAAKVSASRRLGGK